MTANYEQIKNYLLGKLDAPDCERVDLRVIEDEQFATEAFAAEDVLIENYVDGELSDADAELFRSNYLSTDARANRVREFAALRAALSRGAGQEKEEYTEERNERVGLFGRFGLVPAFAGLALLLLVGYGAWFYFSDSGLSELEQQYAALNRTYASDPAGVGTYSTVELLSGTMRGSGQDAKMVGNQLSDIVLFRLPLTFDPGAEARFDAALLKDGRRVFVVKQIQPTNDAVGSEVHVLFPREVISSGQYQISLSRPGTQFAPVVYRFTAQ